MTALSNHQFPAAMLIAADIVEDGSQLALLSAEKLSIWEVNTKQLIREWAVGETFDTQRYLSFSTNKRVVAVANYKQVTILDVHSGKVLNQWDVKGYSPLAKISTLQLARNGNLVLIGLNEGSLIQVDLALHNRSIFKPHSGVIKFVEPIEDSNLILTGSLDGSIKLLDTSTGDNQIKIQTSSRITSLTLNKNGTQFFYSSALDNQQVINLRTGDIVSELNYFERFKYFRKALFINSDKTLINSTPKHQLQVWNLSNGKNVKEGYIKALSFGSTTLDMTTNNEGKLVTVTFDGILETWDLDSLD